MPRANSPFLTSISGSLRGGPTFRATSQTPDIVMQTRPVPTDRRTAKQAAVRDAYSRLAYLWKNLSHLDKEPYQIMAEQRNLTPWNCWLSFHLPILKLEPLFYTAFAEGTGTSITDFSLNGATGTSNGPIWGEKNLFPYLSFDGIDDMLSFPYQSKYSLSNNFSIFCISSGNPDLAKNHSIFSTLATVGDNKGFAYYIGNNRTLSITEYAGGAAQTQSTSNIYQPNVPQAHGLTKAGTTLKFYHNSTIVSRTSTVPAITPTTAPLRVGAFRDRTQPFKGPIHLIAAIPSVLSQAQYEALKNYYLPFYT